MSRSFEPRGPHLMTVLWPVLLASPLLGLAACASRPVETDPAPPRATEAMVRVVNRTNSDVRVEADGQPLGEVPGGGEHFFVGLSPGTVDLRGTSLDGGLSFRRDLLTLEAGETFTWVLREGQVGTGDRAAASLRADATIVVINSTEWDVNVVLDGQLLGATPAATTGRFEGIAAGPHRLEAQAPEASFPQEFPVLEAGETFTWRLRAPGGIAAPGVLPAPGTGRLRVENPHPGRVRVLVNGIALGVVEPGATRIFDNLAAASFRISAESEDGASRYAGPTARIDPGRVTTWRVGAASSDEVAGAPEQLPADAPYEPGLESESSLPPAAGGSGRYPSGPEAVVAGQVFIVENHTSQDLEIFLDGGSAGAVGAGMTERFSDLPGPRFTPSARNASGAREYRHPLVDMQGLGSFSWIIEP